MRVRGRGLDAGAAGATSAPTGGPATGRVVTASSKGAKGSMKAALAQRKAGAGAAPSSDGGVELPSAVRSLPLATAFALATSALDANSSYANAEAAAQAPHAAALGRTVSPSDVALLLVPMTLYSLFSMYRSIKNPQATVSGVSLALTACCLVANSYLFDLQRALNFLSA
ncbi:unnamed protein product [Pedinophyceae sp. YPF-701]|nr:unnamed protein product [Pedinophyceae sp. YPF-701]